MSNEVTKLRAAVTDAALRGPGTASTEARRAAFDNDEQAIGLAARALVDKVTRHAYKITDEDVAAAKVAGLSDDEIFELTVSAALGQSTRQLESALAALATATREQS